MFELVTVCSFEDHLGGTYRTASVAACGRCPLLDAWNSDVRAGCLVKAEPQQQRGFLHVDSTIETETYCGTDKLRLRSTCGIGLVKDLIRLPIRC